MSQYTTKSRKLRLQLTCANQNWKDWKNHPALYEVFRWWAPSHQLRIVCLPQATRVLTMSLHSISIQ